MVGLVEYAVTSEFPQCGINKVYHMISYHEHTPGAVDGTWGAVGGSVPCSRVSPLGYSWNLTAVSSGQRRNGPPTEPGFSQGFFSPFCHQWSFGSLPLSPLACLVEDTSFPAISST